MRVPNFYDERRELQEEFGDDELDFSFMVNLAWGGDGLQFLHGECDIFALQLKRKYPKYTVCVIKDEKCACIHAYCKYKQYYIDVRGITSDADEFFDEFADWYTYDAPSKDSSIITFRSTNKYEDYCIKKIGRNFNSEEDAMLLAEADSILVNYAEYYCI
jgi:hypothetical protein